MTKYQVLLARTSIHQASTMIHAQDLEEAKAAAPDIPDHRLTWVEAQPPVIRVAQVVQITPVSDAALDATIAQWEANALATEEPAVRIGRAACPLCKAYWENGCMGCPIAQHTAALCTHTPLEMCRRAWEQWHMDEGAEFRRAATVMVTFLMLVRSAHLQTANMDPAPTTGAPSNG